MCVDSLPSYSTYFLNWFLSYVFDMMFISTGKYGIKWKWLQWWEMWSWGIAKRIQHWHPEAGSSHFWSSGVQQAAVLRSSRALEAFQVSYKSFIVNTIFTCIVPAPNFIFLNPEIWGEGIVRILLLIWNKNTSLFTLKKTTYYSHVYKNTCLLKK